MVQVCARCEAVVPVLDGEPAGFCANCGLPQLRVSHSVLEAAETRQPDEAGVPGVDGSTSEAIGHGPVSRTSLDWPMVLRILLSATFAGILPCFLLHGILFTGTLGLPVLFLLPILCMASGFAYLRARPNRRMSPGGGAQMGLALGTMLAFAEVTVTAIAAFAWRYGRHDRALQQMFDGVMAQAESQVRASQPNASEQLLRAMHSPEWHAGWFLTMQGAMMLLLIVTGMLAGLVAGFLLRVRVPDKLQD